MAKVQEGIFETLYLKADVDGALVTESKNGTQWFREGKIRYDVIKSFVLEQLGDSVNQAKAVEELVQQLKDTIQKRKSEIDNLDEEIARLIVDRGNVEARLNNIKENLAAINRQIAKANQNVDGQSVKKADLQKQSLQLELTEINSELSSLIRKIKKQEEANYEKADSLNLVQKKLSESQKKLLELTTPLAERTLRLIAEIDDDFEQYLADIVPNEELNMPRQFVIEITPGQAVKAAEFINVLDENDKADVGFKEGGWRNFLLRLNMRDIEDKAQSIFERISVTGINEERDVDTYIQRFQQAYYRLGSEAAKQEKAVRRCRANAVRAAYVFEVGTKVAAALQEALGSLIYSLENDGDLNIKIEEFRQKIARFRATQHRRMEFASVLENFLARNEIALRDIHEKFCSEDRVEIEKVESRSVANAMQSAWFLRSIPFIWALIVAITVKYTLAKNTSEILHLYTPEILVASFTVTYMYSYWLGRRRRAKRMVRLAMQSQETLDKIVTSSSNNGPSKKSGHQRNLILDDILTGVVRYGSKIVRFPSEPVSEINPRSKFVTESASSSSRPQITSDIVRIYNDWLQIPVTNSLALLIPLFVFIVASTNIDKHDNAYISVHINGNKCVYASGQLVYATSTSYYIASSTYEDKPGSGVLHRLLEASRPIVNAVLPELNSINVPRERIVAVHSLKNDDGGLKASLEDCGVSADEKSIRVVHEGVAINKIAAVLERLTAKEIQLVFQSDELDAIGTAISRITNGGLHLIHGGAAIRTIADAVAKIAMYGVRIIPDGEPINKFLDAIGEIGKDVTRGPNTATKNTMETSEYNIDVDKSRKLIVSLLENSTINVEDMALFKASIKSLLSRHHPGLSFTDLILKVIFRGFDSKENRQISGGLVVNVNWPEETKIKYKQLLMELTSLFKTTTEWMKNDGRDESIKSLAALNTKLENLRASLEELKQQPNLKTEPIVTAPIAIDASTQVASPFILSPIVNLPAQIERTTNKITHVFVTHFNMLSQKLNSLPLLNALVMPFFPRPMENSMVEELEDAFQWGRNNLAIPIMTLPKNLSQGKRGISSNIDTTNEGHPDYFQYVAKALRSCVVGDENASIEIDVQGHASESWLFEPNSVKPLQKNWSDDYNHYLGEGRRAGALASLARYVANENDGMEILNRIFVATFQESSVPLSKYFQELERVNEHSRSLGSLFSKFRRFEGIVDMKLSRNTWMSKVKRSGSKRKLNPFEELFARSVVLSIVNVQGDSCKFES